MPPAQVVYSKQAVHLAVGDGTTRFVQIGEPVQANDPIVKLYPSCFTDDASVFIRREGPISGRAEEMATSNPGERRARRAR